MKKNIFAALLCILFFTAAYTDRTKPLIFENADYYIFAAAANSSAEMITVNGAQAAKVKATLKRADGETAVYMDKNISRRLLNSFSAAVVFTEITEGIENIYAYSPKLSGGITLKGERVNLHIAVAKDRTCAGSPIIFSGY